MDDKGKTTTLTKEQVVRGKRLFIAACASCHVGGGTRTNQNVGLAIEELSGAQPNRATVEGLVDYLNNPTTYDGLKDPFSTALWQTGFDVVSDQSLLSSCAIICSTMVRVFGVLMCFLSVIKRDRIKLSPELYEVSVMFLALFDRTSLRSTHPSRVATFGQR